MLGYISTGYISERRRQGAAGRPGQPPARMAMRCTYSEAPSLHQSKPRAERNDAILRYTRSFSLGMESVHAYAGGGDNGTVFEMFDLRW